MKGEAIMGAAAGNRSGHGFRLRSSGDATRDDKGHNIRAFRLQPADLASGEYQQVPVKIVLLGIVHRHVVVEAKEFQILPRDKAEGLHMPIRG